jgi:hypothetical protein
MDAITSISQLNLNGKYTYADYLSWKFEEAVELFKGKTMQIFTSTRTRWTASFFLN